VARLALSGATHNGKRNATRCGSVRVCRGEGVVRRLLAPVHIQSVHIKGGGGGAPATRGGRHRGATPRRWCPAAAYTRAAITSRSISFAWRIPIGPENCCAEWQTALVEPRRRANPATFSSASFTASPSARAATRRFGPLRAPRAQPDPPHGTDSRRETRRKAERPRRARTEVVVAAGVQPVVHADLRVAPCCGAHSLLRTGVAFYHSEMTLF
jgi:hypothetical protein